MALAYGVFLQVRNRKKTEDRREETNNGDLLTGWIEFASTVRHRPNPNHVVVDQLGRLFRQMGESY